MDMFVRTQRSVHTNIKLPAFQTYDSVVQVDQVPKISPAASWQKPHRPSSHTHMPNMSQSTTCTCTCSTANDVPENIKDDIIRAADNWDLARNEYYLNLQRKLHEKSASLDRMRYVPHSLQICLRTHLYGRRDFYLELVQALGEEAFDLVPDHYNIRGTISQLEEAKKKLASIS